MSRSRVSMAVAFVVLPGCWDGNETVLRSRPNSPRKGCAVLERSCPAGTDCLFENGRAGPDYSVYFAIGRAVRPQR
jgi:hypothetical protein